VLFIAPLLTTLVASFCAVFGSFTFYEDIVALCGDPSSKLSSVDVFYPVASTPSRQLSISWNIFYTEACLAFLDCPP